MNQKGISDKNQNNLTYRVVNWNIWFASDKIANIKSI